MRPQPWIAAMVALALLAAPSGARAASVHLGDRGLRPGARGHDVRVLQDLLTRDGYPTPVDGRFGPSTRAAVLAFQRAAGLAATRRVPPLTAAPLRPPPPASLLLPPSRTPLPRTR